MFSRPSYAAQWSAVLPSAQQGVEIMYQEYYSTPTITIS